MHCIERRATPPVPATPSSAAAAASAVTAATAPSRAPGWALLGTATLLAACAAPEAQAPVSANAGASGITTVTAARSVPRAASPGVAPARGLAAPATPKSLAQLRQQAARRLVAANPDITYVGEVPEPLLAIPVLEIELNADGSVRRIEVARHPSQARDTTQMAIDAVHRAAPFGDVSRLPKPWKFFETFLFRDDRRFKPRTLDS